MDWFVFTVGVVIGIVTITLTLFMRRDLKIKYGPIKSLQEKTSTLARNINDRQKTIQQLDDQKQDITDHIKTVKNELINVQKQMDDLRKEISLEKKYSQFRSTVLDIASETSEYYQIEYANLLSQIKSEFSSMFYVLEAEKLKTSGITIGRNASYITSEAKSAFSDMNRKFSSLRNRLIDIEQKYFFQKIQVGNKKFSLENIEQKFSQLNDDFTELKDSYSNVGVDVNLNSLLGMARKLYEIKIKYFKSVQREKEQLEALKQAQRESERLKSEIDASNKRIDADIKKTQIEMKRLNESLKNDPQNSEILAAIHDKEDVLIGLHEEIAKNEERKVEKAGWVYIISNPLNTNIFKIGTTRRLNPQDRIDELASASIPFDFRVHSVIYSNDCFNMESTIHNKLSNSRVNKVNLHKEFFYSTPVEMERLILDTDPTAEFVENPKSEEYDISVSSNEIIANENAATGDN